MPFIMFFLIQNKMKRTQSEADLTGLGGGGLRGNESTPDTPKESTIKFSLKKRTISVDSGIPGNVSDKQLHILLF